MQFASFRHKGLRQLYEDGNAASDIDLIDYH